MIITKLLLAGALFVFAINAQDVNISGIVKDTSGAPLAGAVVRLEKGGQTVNTEADGVFTFAGTRIDEQNKQAQPPRLPVKTQNGLLIINIPEKTAVGVVTFTIQGKVVNRIQQTLEAGTHYLALPCMGNGVYLHKVKIGGSRYIVKGISLDGITLSVQGASPDNILSKQAKVFAEINDGIAVTKTGYLNYRVVVRNSDTSGIEIRMIVCEDTVTDADGNVYQAVKIGNQVWTVENLRTTKYNDNTPVLLDTSKATWAIDTTAKYCYYNNTTNADSLKEFNALYNWYAVNTGKLAPTGWHVPTDSEWTILGNCLIDNGYNWDGSTTGNKIGKSMATKTGWRSSKSAGAAGNDVTKNNSCGFSGPPGGYRYNNGGFFSIGSGGNWWSVTQGDVLNAYGRKISYDYDYLYRNSGSKSCGFSVRLLRDN